MTNWHDFSLLGFRHLMRCLSPKVILERIIGSALNENKIAFKKISGTRKGGMKSY